MVPPRFFFLPLAIAFEDSAERRALRDIHVQTERQTSYRCERLRGEFVYDFEIWFPPDPTEGATEWIQRRPLNESTPEHFSPENILPSFQEASTECGTSSSIPWCVYKLITDSDCHDPFILFLHELDTCTDGFDLIIGVNVRRVDTTTTKCLSGCLDFSYSHTAFAILAEGEGEPLACLCSDSSA